MSWPFCLSNHGTPICCFSMQDATVYSVYPDLRCLIVVPCSTLSRGLQLHPVALQTGACHDAGASHLKRVFPKMSCHRHGEVHVLTRCLFTWLDLRWSSCLLRAASVLHVGVLQAVCANSSTSHGWHFPGPVTQP